MYHVLAFYESLHYSPPLRCRGIVWGHWDVLLVHRRERSQCDLCRIPHHPYLYPLLPDTISYRRRQLRYTRDIPLLFLNRKLKEFQLEVGNLPQIRKFFEEYLWIWLSFVVILPPSLTSREKMMPTSILVSL